MYGHPGSVLYMETTRNFAAITSKRGVHVTTTTHSSKGVADAACRKAIRLGWADEAAVWEGNEAVSFHTVASVGESLSDYVARKGFFRSQSA